MRPKPKTSRRGFTLIELLVVIAIIAILSIVVVLTLNPAELLRQSRDANRLSSEQTLNSAIGLASVNGLSLGTPDTIYVSIPDPTLSGNATSTCGALGLPTVLAPWTYQCVSAQNLRNTNGTGWIPITFNTIPSGSPIGALPIDSTNNTSTYLFQSYGTDGNQFELTTHMESAKYAPSEIADGGEYIDLQEAGTNPKLDPVDLGGGNLFMNSIAIAYIGDILSNNTLLAQLPVKDASGTSLALSGGLATDALGNIWETDGARVVEFSPSGVYVSQFGSSGSGVGQFGGLTGIAFNKGGNIYTADSGNSRIEEFSSGGAYINEFGSAGSATGQFNGMTGIAIDPTGNIWAGDNGNSRVQEFSATGTWLGAFGSAGTGGGQFTDPLNLAFDPYGNLWVTDGGTGGRLEEFSATGTYLNAFGSTGTGNGQFSAAGTIFGIAITRNGYIYAADVGGFRLEEFSVTGTYVGQYHLIGIPRNITIQQ